MAARLVAAVLVVVRGDLHRDGVLFRNERTTGNAGSQVVAQKRSVAEVADDPSDERISIGGLGRTIQYCDT